MHVYLLMHNLAQNLTNIKTHTTLKKTTFQQVLACNMNST